MILLFLGIFLTAINIDFKTAFAGLKTAAAGKKRPRTAGRARPPGRLLSYTGTLIEKSNIRLLFGYNVLLHLLLCLCSSLVSFAWISGYLNPLASVAFAGVAFMFPYIALRLISDYYEKKEKRNAIDFLIILKNFFIAGRNDIFEAFKNANPYFNEPIKSYTDMMVFEYEHRINALACLGNLKKKLGTPELKQYVENLAICYVQGGDYVGLTDTFIQELSGLDEDDEREDTEDKLLGYGLYMLLALNFAIVWWMVRGPYRTDILGSLWGQCIFILDMLASMYIIYMSLKRV